MNKREVEPIIKAVWLNGPDKRYIPRSNGHGYGWDIWDKRSNVWVKSLKKIAEIDPEEPLKLS